MLKVIPNQVYVHTSGRQTSPYGAAPWTSPQDKPNWTLVQRGWTWADTETGTVGLGRPAMSTREDAEAFAAHWNAQRAAARAQHERDWAPVMAPIAWTKQRGNDGVLRHHSGEGWSIVKHGPTYIVENRGEKWIAVRSLAKAKEQAGRMIRSDRQEKTFG